MHVIMNVLSLLAIVQWLLGDWRLHLGQMYVCVTAVVAMFVAVATVVRSIRSQSAEHEFRLWYRVPDGHELVFDSGWWKVQPAQDGTSAGTGQPAVAQATESS